MLAAFAELAFDARPFIASRVRHERFIRITPRRIRILQRIPKPIHIPVVGKDLGRIWHNGIRREELPNLRVVVAGVEVVETALACPEPAEGSSFCPVQRLSVRMVVLTLWRLLPTVL